MTLEVVVHAVIAETRPALEVAFQEALEAAGVTSRDLRGGQSYREFDPPRVQLRRWVLTEDPDRLSEAVRGILIGGGYELLEFDVRISQLVEQAQVNAGDASYDITSGTLTVEGIGRGDIEIDLLRFTNTDEIRGLMRSEGAETGLRDFRRIVIRRVGS